MVATKADVTVEARVVPAGAFEMGDADGRGDEQPVHEVYISAFRAALCPVTNEEYARFLTETGHEPPRFFDDARFNAARQPVVGVSWHDAVAYCGWLAARTGERWRLPTEAEREKAARGGVAGARYPWGDDAGPNGGAFGQDALRPVGLSAPNGYGLFDMGYNVHEWCSDWYGEDYYARSPKRDPKGPASGRRRASRGGAWRHQIKVSRCAARSSLDPSFRYNDYGFRVYRDA
ncbi:MAG TPA: SUMF1/EgtB/PvdO family nonheme iron enzyme [Dehalococcoidia bacterium]|nr:SUMF1/EgtB/PvdO family nonheme iron enzyme [Dehalococcoidia bacterium]